MTSESVHAERAVLGGIMLSCDSIPPGIDVLSPADFSLIPHRQIFQAMIELHDSHEPIDVVTVGCALKGEDAPEDDSWSAFLSGLVDDTPTVANVEHYASEVRRQARRRDFIGATTRAMNKAKDLSVDGDELMTDVINELGQLAESRALLRPTPMSEIVSAEYKAIEQRASGGVSGLSTGFKSVDELTGGMPKGALIVVAARPGMGKSAFVSGIVRDMVTARSQSALIFSLEMSHQEQAQRFLAAESRTDLRRIRSGKVFAEDYQRLANAADRLHTSRLSIADKSDLSITDLRSIARQHHHKRKTDLVVVDYLQLMTGIGDNREQQVASMTRGLLALARELAVPVVAISQLNRSLESRNDKRPMLSDLRESGSIEQDAHQVIFIYRDDYYNPKSADAGTAEISVGKNRNGPTGMVKLQWEGKFTRFNALDYEPPTGEYAATEYEYES